MNIADITNRTSASDDRRQSYFIRHWRGDCSLTISLLSLLIALIAPVAVSRGIQAVIFFVIGGPGELRWHARITLGGLALWFALEFWANIGLWRAARRCTRERGRSFLTVAANLTVAFWLAIAIAVALLFRRTQLHELVGLSLGSDSISKPVVKLSASGNTLLIDGTLGEGSADLVERTLGSATKVQEVEFNSIGGRAIEALRIGRAIRTKRLRTPLQV